MFSGRKERHSFLSRSNAVTLVVEALRVDSADGCCSVGISSVLRVHRITRAVPSFLVKVTVVGLASANRFTSQSLNSGVFVYESVPPDAVAILEKSMGELDVIMCCFIDIFNEVLQLLFVKEIFLF
jgi:hypothetical protein